MREINKLAVCKCMIRQMEPRNHWFIGPKRFLRQNKLMIRCIVNVLPWSGPPCSQNFILKGKHSPSVRTLMPLKGSTTSLARMDNAPGGDSVYPILIWMYYTERGSKPKPRAHYCDLKLRERTINYSRKVFPI